MIPTRDRSDYLRVTLASVVPQARRAGAEVLIVDSGDGAGSAALAAEHGARLIQAARAGANAARNAGIRAAGGDPIVLVDDDIEAPPGWLQELLYGIVANPECEVFGGPIRARLEGGGPRACGREPAPITTLDRGSEDRDVELVWSANMAIRRAALERVGPFDESIHGRGEEEDWQRRHRAAGGQIRYLAAAGLEHRRTARDATVTRLSRTAYALGRSARRYDRRRGEVPSLRGELRTLAGCLWHVVRRRCAVGFVLGAHAAGRLREALVPDRDASRPPAGDSAPPVAPGPRDDFLSGTHGQVIGPRATVRALAADALADAATIVRLQPGRLRRVARTTPRQRVLVLSVEREDVPNLLADARAELLRSHHDVRFAVTTTGRRGKFENLNTLLTGHPAAGHDWLLVLDDDVALPAGFLDEFLFLAGRFHLRLAQPAHRHYSHAAFQITRRRAASVVRETAFVEIGPVTAFHASTFATLLPFPPLRVGWGLDAHWSALAAQQGWPIGVVDATPIRHGLRQIATSYDRSAAIAEARNFLAGRPYTPAADAQRTLRVHRSWR